MMRATGSRAKKQRPIIVIGAGMAGVETALTLADEGHRVILIEGKDRILSGTSDRTPCRVGLGLHYADPVTAKKYLRATIAFVRKYSEFLLKPSSPELAGSDYLVMPDSHVQYPQIGSLHGELVAEYKALCEEDPANELFGNPNKLMVPSAIPEMFDVERHPELRRPGSQHPAFCFRTKEVILDWPQLKEYLTERAQTHRNIQVYTGTSVESIHKTTPADMGRVQEIPSMDSKIATAGSSADDAADYGLLEETTKWTYRVSDPSYIITCKQTTRGVELSAESSRTDEVFSTSDVGFSRDGEHTTLTADIVVNCSWYDIRRLNSTYGLASKPQTARLKAMVEVLLPENLRNIRTSFFCFGPYCAITNLGNGHAFVTYEPVTNMDQSSDENLPTDMRRFLDGEATSEEKSDIAQRILDGASNYIPGINTAKVKNVTFGVVLTDGGAVDINDPHSPHHLRTENGVQDHEFGFASNACMKLLYGVQNAQKIESIVKSYTYIQENINSFLEVFQDLPRIEYNKPVISYFFKEYMHRYENFLPEREQDRISNRYTRTLSNKITLLDQFKKAREEFHSHSTEGSSSGSSEVDAASDEDAYTPTMFGKPQKYKKPYPQEEVKPWITPGVRVVKAN